MRKICAVTANRADFSRIETMLEAINDHDDLELQLVVMGSHLLEKTGSTINEIKRKGFKIDRTLYMEVAGANMTTMTKSVGLAIVELSTIFDQLKPDIVLAPVDRFESMAIGTAAALMNIHVAHTQGGEVTGTIDESIRHALTKMAHMHFVASEESRERVIKMGEHPEMVFNVGCPGTDLLLRTPVFDRSETLRKFNEALVKAEHKLDPEKPYALVVQHPVTTEFESAAKQVEQTMKALKGRDEQVIMLWPNIDAGSDDISRTIRTFERDPEMKDRLFLIKHIPTELFVSTLKNTSCLVGNSSAGMREACYFGVPVVNIGTRQESRERGSNVVDVGYDAEAISAALATQITHGSYPVEHVYGDGTAGVQFAKICAEIELPPIQKKITY